MNESNTGNMTACVGPDCAGETRGGTPEAVYRPLMDQYDFSDRYEIHFDIPGSSIEGIGLIVHENVLTVEAGVPVRRRGAQPLLLGEYRVGPYRRKIRLGEDIDADAIGASYADGVLVLALPKRAERQPRRIPVSGG